ncbi:unnamed protein product, partial [Polarella glacialis]
MILPTLILPRSSGSISLRSADPGKRDYPVIQPSYLTDPVDMAILTEGYRLVERVVASPPLAEVCAGIHPDSMIPHALGSDEYVKEHIRKGLSGLRVADASIMPKATGTGTWFINSSAVLRSPISRTAASRTGSGSSAKQSQKSVDDCKKQADCATRITPWDEAQTAPDPVPFRTQRTKQDAAHKRWIIARAQWEVARSWDMLTLAGLRISFIGFACQKVEAVMRYCDGDSLKPMLMLRLCAFRVLSILPGAALAFSGTSFPRSTWRTWRSDFVKPVLDSDPQADAARLALMRMAAHRTHGSFVAFNFQLADCAQLPGRGLPVPVARSSGLGLVLVLFVKSVWDAASGCHRWCYSLRPDYHIVLFSVVGQFAIVLAGRCTGRPGPQSSTSFFRGCGCIPAADAAESLRSRAAAASSAPG